MPHRTDERVRAGLIREEDLSLLKEVSMKTARGSFKSDKNCHKSAVNNHIPMQKKIIYMGDFLHLGHSS